VVLGDADEGFGMVTPTGVWPAAAQDVARALKDYETRAVGGWVRSLLRGEKTAGVECDLATTATPEQMEAAFIEAGLAFSDEGRRWGTLRVLGLGTGDSEVVEVTTLREDAYTAGSRYPNVKFVGDWSADAARRDFTFNAIYLGADGSAFDPYNGQNDLAGGVVRFIGDPAVRLREDPLRWLRFFRFCAMYGLNGLTDDMKGVLDGAAPALRNLSRHRVAREWEKLQSAPQADAVMKIIRQEGWQKTINERLGHGPEEN
jgi:tRNA nucleotidyltransferase/poly(A) polymerase